MATVRRLQRNQRVDVSSDGTTWLKLKDITSTDGIGFSPDTQDATAYDGGGYKTNVTTLMGASLAVTFTSLLESGAPNAAQKLVTDCEGLFGADAMLYVRVYDIDGGDRGWTFQAEVNPTQANSAVGGLRQFNVTFNPDGSTITRMSTDDIAAAIANTAKPATVAASQTGTGVGSLVTLTGANYTGATSVKFGATDATSYTVVSDSRIVCIVPTGGTGSQDITVTNTAGTGDGLTFTVAA
jgi:hypothetical protein